MPRESACLLFPSKDCRPNSRDGLAVPTQRVGNCPSEVETVSLLPGSARLRISLPHFHSAPSSRLFRALRRISRERKLQGRAGGFEAEIATMCSEAQEQLSRLLLELEGGEETTCLICAGPLDYVAVHPCGHGDVCALCTARLRQIIGDKRCCACQREAKSVLVTKNKGEDTAKFPVDIKRQQKNGKVFAMKASRGIFFDNAGYRDQLSLKCGLSCVVCTKRGESGDDAATKDDSKTATTRFGSLKALKSHLKDEHGLYFCDVCLDGRKVFVQEQVLYTKSELARHKKKGDTKGVMAEAGFKGHPRCQFCNKHFYSDQELYAHMQSRHLQCFLCRRERPSDYVYYKNLADLTAHFTKDHHFCNHPDCKSRHPEERVFLTKEDLSVHRVQTHGESLSKSQKKQALKINVNFPSLRHQDASGGRQHPQASGRGPGLTGLSSQARPFIPGRMGGGDWPRPASAYHDGGATAGEGSGRSNYTMIDDDIGLLAGRNEARRRVTQSTNFPPLMPVSPPEEEDAPHFTGATPEEETEAGDQISYSSRLLQPSSAPAPHPTDADTPSGETPSGGGGGETSRVSGFVNLRDVRVSAHKKTLMDKLEALVAEEPKVIEERRSWRQQLADAFGVSDPDRPSTFALSSAVAVPEDVLLYAGKHLDFVIKVERVVQYFAIQNESKRMPLPPMIPMQRKVVHVVCNLHKVVSQAYGAEPFRCVNLIKNPSGSQDPVESLSKMAKAKLEGADVPTAQATGWELKLVDVDPELKVRELLVYEMHLDPELQVEMVKDRSHPKNLKTALVKFSSEKNFQEARAQLAGGMRGRFLVVQS